MRKAGILILLVLTCMVVGPAAAAVGMLTSVEGNPKCPDTKCGGEDLLWETPMDEKGQPVIPVGKTIEISDTYGHTVAITFVNAYTIDWKSDAQVEAVIVKGGPNANVYEYCPDYQSGDSGLTTPEKIKKPGTYPDISSIRFCIIPPVAVPEFPTVSVGMFICIGFVGAVLFFRERS